MLLSTLNWDCGSFHRPCQSLAVPGGAASYGSMRLSSLVSDIVGRRCRMLRLYYKDSNSHVAPSSSPRKAWACIDSDIEPARDRKIV